MKENQKNKKHATYPYCLVCKSPLIMGPYIYETMPLQVDMLCERDKCTYSGKLIKWDEMISLCKQIKDNEINGTAPIPISEKEYEQEDELHDEYNNLVDFF
jgi:hypothetical protein